MSSKKNYQYFKDSELLSPNSMAYVEQVYEDAIDGVQGLGISQELVPYLTVATKHRQLCDQLRGMSHRPQSTQTSVSVDFIDAYRTKGHLSVDLGLFTDNRVASPIAMPSGTFSAMFAGKEITQDAQAWQQTLQQTYCQDIGYEFMHLIEEEQSWFANMIEQGVEISQEAYLKAYADLIRAEGLERHLGIQFVGQKRFSLEGCEAFIPALEQVINTQVSLGYDDMVIGMAHRGRLNTLVNVLGVSVAQLMAEFEGSQRMGNTSGDVKYHLGHSIDRSDQGRDYHIALAYNPSHLEAINAVVMGNVRARIDRGSTKATGIIVHGDASIAGQGVVMEGLTMSQVPAYHIGGVVHFVINNQIGFTTNPSDARSTQYCTDIAKMISAPVMHVNAGDIPAVIRAAKIAALYKDRFKKDVFIDIIGHRKYGHNEADEPRATQPLMYQAIAKRSVVSKDYGEFLRSLGIEQSQLDEIQNDVQTLIKQGERLIPCSGEAVSTRHKDWQALSQSAWDAAYQIPIDHAGLTALAKTMTDIPKDIQLQRQVGMLMTQRQKMAQSEEPLNWGMAELMAYQVLLNAGHSVRLVGQDAIRGTFSHRQASVFDQDSGERYSLLKPSKQGVFENYNSVLSEYAALGFEYGYAETSPNTLVVFEAQFGDFINGAQIIIDQFISSGYQKWQRHCGVVLLLPHGYEGQGPEHSSARMERFLQLCAEENMQVCVPTTPKQIYHLLLRQIFRSSRTPLVICSPKSLLRHPLAVSEMASLDTSGFESVIADGLASASKMVLCSGKIYYDLYQYQNDQNINDVSLVRMEQLHPFPEKALSAVLKPLKSLKQVIWCQEEPKNQGAWTYIRDWLEQSLPKGVTLTVVARRAAAASAVGYLSQHKVEQEQLLKEVFQGDK
ncbi:2-oxoglutarate dehydrogenase E1 component [Candidatus Synchoanobacter obligatus]|uniref:oxoglutarate dehydrogenase (succinyl-transferring) n=1 Tax=Candidatus Synchoanobacter obligatus TaxID=2919597 RepID=A0ABT1L3T7_9GAMM|nr:2-oxoglutarate dehydrogenase E1 component [Candidatus Synchoanobacter obligatus]MCP8351867.1 2-oxoglutarate dehydrogenase E1 component [Candidatus Synchoanobacter obligatus]